MAQFVFALVMGVNAIVIGCDFPMWMQYAMVAYMVSFLVLFSR
jgi:elongation of very long chain fatty acids protein 4